jgi:hypothetical protein
MTTDRGLWWCADWTTCDFQQHKRWRSLEPGEYAEVDELPVEVTECTHTREDESQVRELLEASS